MVQRVEMLGVARVITDEQQAIQLRPTLRDQALAYLAYTGDWTTRDRLGFLFWADTPDRTARHNVRQLLKRIRRLDWLTGFEVDGDRIRWVVATDVADLRHPAGGDRNHLSRTGTLLPYFERGASFEFQEWLRVERRLVLAAWQTALLRAAEEAERVGRTDEALELLEPALDEIDDDAVLIRYMDMAARAGHRDKSIGAFRRVSERMRVDLGLEPTASAQALFERLVDTTDADRGEEPTSIVGRRRETEEILAFLARPACRLLTLLGPGGIGKSTLAGVVARNAVHMFDGGSLLLSLESISDPSSIPSVIAGGLNVGLDGRIDPVDRLISVLRKQDLLLVLDNVEHLPGGWILFSELEKACPRLKILVTSRERLRLEDEWVYEVEGLAPAEAVELVLRRSRQVASGVAVSADHARALSEAVGGSPLGIELAVPWLRVMTPEEIINDVLGHPAWLSGGNRDAPSRHRSLEAAMAHSWRLLTDPEKQAIEALSIFVAPFTRELAEQVGQLEASLLRDLTDKSLVGSRGDGLYASHPLVRQYGASRLASDSRRRSDVRHRHARAILGLLDPPDRAMTHRRHLDDMIVGWQCALELADQELIGRAVDGFGLVLDSMGRISLGLELLARARTTLDDDTFETRSVLASLQVAESRLLQRLGRHRESAERARAAAQAATDSQSPYWLVRALISLAWARKWTEGHAAQHESLLEAMSVAESLDDELLVTEVLRGLGCSAPELAECRDYLTDALRRVVTLDVPIVHCHVLSNLGSVYWGLGEIHKAMDLHQKMAGLARENGLVQMGITAQVDLAFLYCEAGDLETARELSASAEYQAAAAEFVDLKLKAAQVAGEISRQAGDFEGAQARVCEGLRLASSMALPPFGLRSLRLHGQLLIDRGDFEKGLGLLALVCSWTQRGPDFTGWILDPRIWDESTKVADPELIEGAWAWAETQNLGDVVESVLAENGD